MAVRFVKTFFEFLTEKKNPVILEKIGDLKKLVTWDYSTRWVKLRMNPRLKADWISPQWYWQILHSVNMLKYVVNFTCMKSATPFSSYLRVCLIGVNSENDRLWRLGICVWLTTKFRNGRFGRFGRPAKPSAPTGGRFGRLWRDSHFDFRNFENEANLLMLLL